jgi:GDP-L-fucose synthase
MNFLRDQRILVTGGLGFLGTFVCEQLRVHDLAALIVPRKSDYDLTEQNEVRQLVKDHQPDIIIHLAARVGGIGANQANPGRFYYDNAIMGLMLMEEARKSGVKKFVSVGTICSYPKYTPVPFKEENLWNGYPEETNAPYGIAKKGLLVQGQAYRKQYGFNAITLLPVNLYGPNDNFDPASSHVIPALIKKVFEAKKNKIPFIEVWGTGSASREFLYVRDAAEGIVVATEKYNSPEPVNLGTGQEITIRALVELICELSDFHGEIRWDQSKPDGQMKRCLDTSRAKEQFGWVAQTPFRDGLRETIGWYEQIDANNRSSTRY